MNPRWRPTRRDILRAAGVSCGGAILAPLASRIASAESDTPRRFVFVIEGNGFEPVTMLSTAARAAIDAHASAPIGDARWWYDRVGHASTLIAEGGLETAPALGALADGGPSLLSHAAVVFGLSSKIVGGGHSAGHGALSSARTVAGVAGGATIDARLASLDSVRKAAPFDAVRLGVGSSLARSLDFGTCAYGKGQSAPLLLHPTTAYELLFGSVASAESALAFERRGDLLDFGAADAQAALARLPAAGAERAKVEAYLASFGELSKRHARMLELAPTLAAARPPGPSEDPRYASSQALERFAAQVRLATASLVAGLTNVCVVGCGTGGDFNVDYEGIVDVDRHTLHHGSGSNAAYRDAIHEVTRRQVAEVATMARTLLATPDVNGGTMLDHTAIVYVGDNGEQHHSQAREFPMLLLGGSALGLRTGGRTVVFPGEGAGDAHRQLSNLWNTLGHLTCEPFDDFGQEGPLRVAEGALSELLA